MKTRNSHGLLQLGREASAYCQCASALISGNKALFVSVDLIGEKNQVILEWRIMRGECDPKYPYSLIVSHYSLHSPHWKRGIRNPVNALLDKDKMDEHGTPTEKRNADTNVANRTISGLSGKPRTTPIDTEWSEETDCNVAELRPDTEHPGQRGMKLTYMYNEYETETHRTNL